MVAGSAPALVIVRAVEPAAKQEGYGRLTWRLRAAWPCKVSAMYANLRIGSAVVTGSVSIIIDLAGVTTTTSVLIVGPDVLTAIMVRHA